MNIPECVKVLSQSFRKNAADGLNKSRTIPPKLRSQQHQQMDLISNSQNGDNKIVESIKEFNRRLQFISTMVFDRLGYIVYVCRYLLTIALANGNSTVYYLKFF